MLHLRERLNRGLSSHRFRETMYCCKGLWENSTVKQLRIAAMVPVILILGACTYSQGPDTTARTPEPPTGLSATIVPEGVQLSWDSVPGAQLYSVFWGDNDYTYRGYFQTKESRFIIGGLTKGELYSFAVTAWNTRGESDYSLPVLVVHDDDPARARDYVAHADRLMRKGNYQYAQAYLATAIRLDPGDPIAYQRRAQLFRRTNRAERAREDASRAEKIMKEKPLSGDTSAASEARLASQ